MSPRLVSPAGTTAPPSPGDSLALPSRGPGSAAWVQAALLTVLAWAALLCAGLGGPAGLASQSLANKLAANAQTLQRQGGTSQASRTLRRDHAAATPVQWATEASQALAQDLSDGLRPADPAGLRSDARRADVHPLAATEPHLKPRPRAHPSRAPPLRA